MSDDRRVDYDYELGNGWNPWQQLILRGMKENSDDIRALTSSVQDVKTDVALVKLQTTQMHDTLSSQGGDILVLQNKDNFLSGIWKAAVVVSSGSVAIVGLIAALLQVGWL